MHVYLAAPFEYQERMKIIRAALHVQPGIEVVSRWLDEPPGQDRAAMAALDLGDVRAADVLILNEEGYKVRGGMHVEFGYALALGKKVAVVGQRFNIFQYLPEVYHFDNWGDCITWLKKEQSEHYEDIPAVNHVAHIVGESSAGPDQQKTVSSGPGNDWPGAPQGNDIASRRQRRTDFNRAASQAMADVQRVAEGAD